MTQVRCTSCGNAMTVPTAGTFACPHCQQPVTLAPAGVPVARAIAAPKKKMGLIKRGAIVLFGLAVFGTFVGHEERSKGRTASTSPAVAATPPPPAAAPIPVNAIDLIASFKANEVRAQNRWKGKRVAINGYVRSVSLDFKNDEVVKLVGKPGDMFEGAFLSMASGVSAANLNKGDRVTMTCVVSGEIMGSPMLDKCQ